MQPAYTAGRHQRYLIAGGLVASFQQTNKLLAKRDNYK